MEHVIRDLRLAIRLFSRQPGFVAVAVLTLSVGIGGSTAIFSVIDAALLRPLPYAAPDRMVDIHVDERQRDGRVFGLSPSVEDVRDWQEHQRVFSETGSPSGTG
jgi:putative ABC transport system permease protein